jgi:hypothetical protein
MRRLTGLVAAAVMVIANGACTYHRAYMDLKDEGGDIRLKGGSWEGESLGVVRASEGGPVWKSCTAVAEASIWILLEETRARGGNAIGDFRWVPAHPKHSSEAPMCRQRWGWFLVWPAVLSHAFQSAGVEAVAYKIDEGEPAPAGVFAVPESRDEQRVLVAHLVGETNHLR